MGCGGSGSQGWGIAGKWWLWVEAVLGAAQLRPTVHATEISSRGGAAAVWKGCPRDPAQEWDAQRAPILMQRLLLLVSLFLLAFAPMAQAQNLQPAFYVNGATGVDTPLAGIPAPAPVGWTPSAPAPTGWKTIGYAIPQVQAWMAAFAPAVPTARIFIQSGQTYSPGTNGEVFPITMAPSIELISSSMSQTAMPRLDVPAGAIAITFPANQSFFYRYFTPAPGNVRYSNSGLRYLQFVGGAVGVQMGANSANRHNSIVEWCEFQDQATAGIQVVTDSGVNDPKVYRNTFLGSFRGVEMIANGTGPSLAADIEECSFLSNVSVMSTGIYLLDNSTGVSSNGVGVGGIFRSNNFEGIQSGVYIEARGGQQIRYPRVFRSRFASIVASAVEARLVNSVGQDLVVTDCVMMNCTAGVKVSGVAAGGAHDWRLSNNTFYQCSRGLDVSVAGTGSATLLTEKHLVRECSQAGYRVNLTASGASPLTFAMTSQQDRLLDNQRSVELLGSAAGSFTLQSSMVCRGRTLGEAVFCSNPNMALALDGCTLADNSRAIHLVAYNAAASTFGHLIFDGNAADVIPTAAPAPSFTYSCFSGPGYPGIGNIRAQPAQLVRPFFKLAFGSPCIDAGNPLPATFGQDYEGEARAISAASITSIRRDIGADEVSPNGSGFRYGNVGFEQFNVFPRIAVSGTPFVSPSVAQMRFDLIDARQPVFGVPAFGAVLFVGQDDVSRSPLPFDLAPLGWPGSYVQVDPIWSSGLVLSGPDGSTSLSIGIAPGLTGVAVTAQWFVLMPPPYDVVTSDAVRVVVGNSIAPAQSLNMVPIAPGTFPMGSNGVGFPSTPVHAVTLTHPFWMSKFEVTQADYQAIMGVNPSSFLGAQRPVEGVSKANAMAFCAALTARQSAVGGLPSGYVYRLPTEAEWEYCCRAGTTTDWHTGATAPGCGDANVAPAALTPPCLAQTSNVGSYPPNAWGLHDMHGNVGELVLDQFSGGYAAGAVSDPLVSTGTLHIYRGGSRAQGGLEVSSAKRAVTPFNLPSQGVGFRVVLAPDVSTSPFPPASLNLVPIQPGSFQMGSSAVGGAVGPVHQVTITRAFWAGKFEVTQAEYLAVMGVNPSSQQGPAVPNWQSRPVESVSWTDAVAYCAALNATYAGQIPAGHSFRLPTEAEWEYMCRAGTTTEWNVGSSLACADANYVGCAVPPETKVVGSYPANVWGLHDMHGNVWEWSFDAGTRTYNSTPSIDPVGSGGANRVFRGGSWQVGADSCRSAFRRLDGSPTYTDINIGFRIVLAPTLPVTNP